MMMLSRYINRLATVVIITISLYGCTEHITPELPIITPPTEGDAVNFMPSLSKAPISSFVNGDKLGVGAYQTDKDGNWNPLSTPELMYNTELTKITGSFSYSPVVYYPANGNKLKFFAYYPYSAKSGDNGITISPKTQAGYPVIDFDAAVGSFNIDMLAAVTEAQSEGNVTLSCQHLLTKINVSVKAPSVDASVTVTEIKISNVNSRGQLSFDNYTNKPAATETWWTNQATPVTISETVNIVADNTKYTSLFAEPKMVVPQSQNDVVIEIKYKFEGDETTYTKSYPQNVAWKAGGSINYQIDIASNKIQLAPNATFPTTMTSMSVWGYTSQAGSAGSLPVGAAPIVNMNPAQVAKSGDVWSYTPTANWSSGKFHTFVATAPATTNVRFNNAVVTYTNPVSLSDQVDLQIATMQQITPNNTANVQLAFTTALTPLKFEVKANVDLNGYINSLYVDEIVIGQTNGIARSATVDLTKSQPTWVQVGTDTTAYSITPTEPVYVSNGATETIPYKKDVPYRRDPELRVIPQSVSNVTITVSVSYLFSGSSDTITEDIVFTFPDAAKWKAGEPYIYKLEFNQENITKKDDGGGTDPFG